MSILCPLDGKECWSSGCFFQHGQNKICTKQNFTIATDRTVMTKPIDQATKVMSNTDKHIPTTETDPNVTMASLRKKLTNANKKLASLRKQLAKKDEDAIQAIDALTKQIAELMHQLKQKDLEAKYWLTQSKTLQSELKQKEDENREQLIEFKRWYDKLTPAQKCTVWPPAGSGIGTGLYTMEDSDLIDKFLSHKKKNLSA